nr:unnamed protein product [Callosobruchus chinensis]
MKRNLFLMLLLEMRHFVSHLIFYVHMHFFSFYGTNQKFRVYFDFIHFALIQRYRYCEINKKTATPSLPNPQIQLTISASMK